MPLSAAVESSPLPSALFLVPNQTSLTLHFEANVEDAELIDCLVASHDAELRQAEHVTGQAFRETILFAADLFPRLQKQKGCSVVRRRSAKKTRLPSSWG